MLEAILHLSSYGAQLVYCLKNLGIHRLAFFQPLHLGKAKKIISASAGEKNAIANVKQEEDDEQHT